MSLVVGTQHARDNSLGSVRNYCEGRKWRELGGAGSQGAGSQGAGEPGSRGPGSRGSGELGSRGAGGEVRRGRRSEGKYTLDYSKNLTPRPRSLQPPYNKVQVENPRSCSLPKIHGQAPHTKSIFCFLPQQHPTTRHKPSSTLPTPSLT
jgi:hypothetical protein